VPLSGTYHEGGKIMVKTLKRLLEFSGENKGNIIKSFIFSILFTICEAIPILAIVYSLNQIILAKEHGTQITVKIVIGAFLIMLIHVGGKIIFGSIANSKSSIACFRMCAAKRIELGDRLKRMPMGYFSSNRLGEIAAAVTTTISDIEFQAGHILRDITVGFVHAVVITIVITIFNLRIGLIAIGAIALGLLVNAILQKRSMAVSPRRQEAQSGLVTAVLEYIQGIAVIKAFGLGEKSNRAVDAAIEESRKQNIGLEEAFIKLIVLYQYVFKVGGCALLMLACYLLVGGTFSLLNTLMIIVSSFVVFSQIETAGSTAALLRMMDSSMDKLEIVEQTPLMDEQGAALQPQNYTIEFKNVSFAYDSRKILDKVNLTIPQKTTVAIVGPSGGGKSTICNLIARFWDVNQGEVRLGGYNVKEYTCESLLKNMSMVFQNVYLFHDTILNNIKFGRPEATMDEVIAAAQKACCHEFIVNLADGYQTMIGEGGCSLSGGEKQRISIARAILKDAPIIILDEATSSVDPENEQQLQLAIAELTKHKTVIMIAHRLATVRNADNILVLSGGRIVQQGRHEQLICEDGIYREFVDIRKTAVGWSL
jgi:ATP-binding cassette subfamily B protein IrtB